MLLCDIHDSMLVLVAWQKQTRDLAAMLSHYCLEKRKEGRGRERECQRPISEPEVDNLDLEDKGAG